jgi:hypothetical protein
VSQLCDSLLVSAFVFIVLCWMSHPVNVSNLTHFWLLIIRHKINAQVHDNKRDIVVDKVT